MAVPEPFLVACSNCGAMTPVTSPNCARCRMPLEVAADATASHRGGGCTAPAVLIAVAVAGLAVALAALLLLAAPRAAPKVGAPMVSRAATGEATARVEPVPPPAAPVEAAPEPSVEAPAPPASAATASAGEAASGAGELPREEIRLVIQQSRSRYRACYERGLARDPALAGRVKVRFVIHRDGSVSDVTDAGSDLPDRNVVACVLRAIGATRFPSSEGDDVTVVYPFVFAPG